jgi:ferredoxin
MRFGHFLMVMYISTHGSRKERISEKEKIFPKALEFYPKSLTSYARVRLKAKSQTHTRRERERRTEVSFCTHTHIYINPEIHERRMFSISRSAASSLASSSFRSPASSSSAKTCTTQRGSNQKLNATVVINHEGKDYTVEVQDGETILDAGLDAGIDLRHDCKMGVCMMCPAKKVTGEVEQSNAMLSDDVLEQGFVLLCCAEPVGDGVKIMTVEEDELLEVQLNA